MAGDGETKFKFEMYRGENLQMRFTAFTAGTDSTELANRIDLTGAQAIWRSKLNAADAEGSTLIRKDSNTASEITILPQGPNDATLGQYDVFLVPADTNAGIALGRHVFDTWIILSGPTQHVVARGDLLMKLEISDLVIDPPGP